MAWLPDGEKIIEDIFIRFDRMYERDRQTNRHGARVVEDFAATQGQ